MATDDPHEPKVRYHNPMPQGYVFVPKGDVFVTKNCRKKTHEAGRELYVVIDKRNKTLGLRCPVDIFEAVQADNEATAGKRAEVVQKKDALVEGKFENEIRRLYSDIPEEEIPKIVKHTLQKRSRRVGTTGTIDVDSKVWLAVRAHIRHTHTNYHALLKTMDREESRKLIADQIKDVEKRWGGGSRPPRAGKRRRVGHGKQRKMRRDKPRTNRPVPHPAGGSTKSPPKKAIPHRPKPRVTTRAAAAAAAAAAVIATAAPTTDTQQTTNGRVHNTWPWQEVNGVVELLDDEDEAVLTDYGSCSELSELSERGWSEFSDS